MSGLFDIEHEERRARDTMMLRDELPNPTPEQGAQLRAMGFAFGRFDPGNGAIHATAPRGWHKEADGARHRVFHIMDERGIRRVSVFWKAPHPFSREHGYGHIEILKPDGLRREWITDGEAVYRERKYFYVLTCDTCLMRVHGSIDAADALESAAYGQRIEAMVERGFRHADGCRVAR